MSEDNPPEVYKVIGAPGTGKTTRVVGNPELPDETSLVMENFQQGYTIDDQMIVTYTKAGTEEAADRLYHILDEAKATIDDRVRTIHSQCYNALGVDQDQVVKWYHKQNFCDKYDLDFGFDDGDDDLMGGDQDEGNALFDIYNWIKNNRKEIEDWEECPAGFPSERDIESLMHRWEDYKEEQDLIEFCDMIEKVVEWGQSMLHENGYPNIFGDNPESAMDTFNQVRELGRFNQEEWRGSGPFINADILYVDEVQDLNPLQWCWYLMQKLVCKQVYIGGDDDQTIYGWAGANPDFMLDEEGDFEVLDRTYRIPEDIWEVCDGVIRQVDKRQEKNVTPDGEGGDVITMRSPSPSRVMEHLINDGDCFVLFRARYMIDEFRKLLHNAGVPYRNNSTFDTWDGITHLRDGLAKMKNGDEKLTKEELEAMMDYAVKKCSRCNGRGCTYCDGGETSMLKENHSFDKGEAAMSNFGGIPQRRVNEIIDTTDMRGSGRFHWRAFVKMSSELNNYEQRAIIGNLSNGLEDLDPEDVTLGTIHSAKGKEAETVILTTDSTQTILANMAEDTQDQPGKRISDAERRVYYVGMTRASEKLVLVQGLIDPEKVINLSDLLEGYEPPKDDWAVQDAEYQSGWN